MKSLGLLSALVVVFAAAMPAEAHPKHRGHQKHRHAGPPAHVVHKHQHKGAPRKVVHVTKPVFVPVYQPTKVVVQRPRPQRVVVQQPVVYVPAPTKPQASFTFRVNL